jgi:hypothetical protein
MTAQTLHGCTKHVLRFYRRLGDDGRALSVSALRPRNLSVPSYRPIQRSGSTHRVVQLEPGSGEEQHTQAVCDERCVIYRSESGCPIKAQGSGDCDLEASWRSLTQGMPPCRAPFAGSSRGCPVRRRAHPLPSLSVGRTYPYRKPPGDEACNRRHGPTSGPVWSRLCLCHVFSPSGRGISVRPDGL